MTNSQIAVVGKDDKLEQLRKELAYTLPSDAQLLAYWHYRNATKEASDFWKVSQKEDGGKADKASGSKQRETSASLIAELRRRSERHGFSKTSYVRDMRALSKWRLLVGQKRDGCIQLDQQLDIEQQKYLQIKGEYKECVKALEEFLARDHEESMRLLSQAEAESQLTARLSARRDELSRRYGHVRLQVYRWEEAWRTVRACHRFLHRVSPQAASPDDEDDDEDLDLLAISAQKQHERVTSVTPRSLHSHGGSDFIRSASLDSLIDGFEKEAKGLSKSSALTPLDLGLYDPSDLLRLFRAIELQNLNALIHLESLGGPMADMIARIDVAEVRVRNEIDDVLEGIKHLEMAIEREEHRGQRLERRSSRLVQGGLRQLVCSEGALQARVLVEEAYESCVAANEAGLEPLAMARGLESAYERLSAELDGLPRHLVLACERDGFREELKQTREADDAARKFALMHRLLAALRRIMEPTEPRRRVLMKRSTPRRRLKREQHGNQLRDAAAKPSAREDLFVKSCKLTKAERDDDDDDDEENVRR